MQIIFVFIALILCLTIIYCIFVKTNCCFWARKWKQQYKPPTTMSAYFTSGLSHHWPNKNILLIDPDRLNQLLLLSILKPTQCKLHSISNAQVLDLLLLEVFLPLSMGLDIIRQYKKYRPQLPIIVQTSLTHEIRSCLAAGCDDFVAKPIQARELLEVMDRAMNI